MTLACSFISRRFPGALCVALAMLAAVHGAHAQLLAGPSAAPVAMNLPAGTPACTSRLGRVGGHRAINGPRERSVGTLLHEMGHAIGLLHEQSRLAEDQYVVTQLENGVQGGAMASTRMARRARRTGTSRVPPEGRRA